MKCLKIDHFLIFSFFSKFLCIIIYTVKKLKAATVVPFNPEEVEVHGKPHRGFPNVIMLIRHLKTLKRQLREPSKRGPYLSNR